MDKRLVFNKIIVLLFAIFLGNSVVQAQKTPDSISIGKQRVPIFWNPYYAIEWNWKYFYERQEKTIDVTKAINRLKAKYPKVAFYTFEPEWPQAFMIIGKDQKMVPSSTLEKLVAEPEIRGLSQMIQLYNNNAPLTFFASSISILLDPYQVHKGKACLHNFDLKLHGEQGQLMDYQYSKPIIDSSFSDFIDQIKTCKYVDLVEPMYYLRIELDGVEEGLIIED